MKFCDNLRSIRHDAGITQKTLGERIGVTPVTIGNWERGVRLPSFDLLPKLADALDTSIDTLLGRNRSIGKDLIEEELLTKYRQLDVYSRKLVHSICDIELERYDTVTPKTVFVKPEETQNIISFKKHNRYIPFYMAPPAAGISVPLEGNEFEMLLADDSVPAEADYAVCISGDSMEPYISNGEMVFVKETQELRNGDIGIFCVDGAMYCKQYYMDELRNLHLLSANPRRMNTNIYVDGEGSSLVRCCGKVLCGENVPLPEYFKKLEEAD